MSDSNETRLPTNITPTHYCLTIKTDLDALTFEGWVSIDLEVHEKVRTTSIVLHALAPLSLTKAVLTYSIDDTYSSHSSSAIEMDEKLERATLKFGEKPLGLSAGSTLKLVIAFKGPLLGTLLGYYKSTFEVDGKPAHYALTQMAPTSARQAFPCWDEPAFKATFDVTLISKKGLVAVSNMPIKQSFGSDGSLYSPRGSEGEMTLDVADGQWTASQFERTPKMSTYLVAYAVGPFESLKSHFVSPLTGRKVPISFLATRDVISQGQYAIDLTAKVVPIYERIFALDFPLPKLDTLVASDYDLGAMENWGLITGRLIVYLHDEKKSGIAAKKRTTQTLVHEIAHQWFGNIVTMEWWDNLWLNEAFATLMGNVIVTKELYPEWRMDSAFISLSLKRAFALDSLRSSHPIEMPCPDSAMINQIFDDISYAKGASVLRMLASMIGEKVFLKGVSIYLKKHLYGNSRTEDLWAGISEASGLDIAKIMRNWTKKIGFPVVTVEETSTGLKIRQNRFLSTADVRPDEDTTLWHVPLEFKTANNDGTTSIDHKAVLDEQREITIPLENANQRFYKLNAETTGVYRVCYSRDRLASLAEEAARKDGFLSLNDRMGLVGDAHVLSKAGYGHTSGSLDLLSKLSGETENLVWVEIDAALSDLASVWWEQPEHIQEGIRRFQRKLFAPILSRLGYEPKEGEKIDDSELRATAFAALVAADDPETIKEAQRLFAPFLEKDDASSIPSDLQTFIFVAAVQHGGEMGYKKALSVYEKPWNPQVKNAAIRALCSASDPALLDETRNMILSGAVKEQDMMFFTLFSASNPKTRRETWQWLQNNLEQLLKRFNSTSQTLPRVIQYCMDSLTSLEDIKEIETYFKDKDTTSFDQTIRRALDAIRSRAGWLSRSTKDVEDWLAANGYLEKAGRGA